MPSPGQEVEERKERREEEQEESDVGGISAPFWLPTSVRETSTAPSLLLSAGRREQHVHFSESQERKGPVSPTNSSSRSSTSTTNSATTTQEQQQQQLVGMTMTAGGRIRESREFLLRVMGEGMFDEARRRSQEEGLEVLFVGDKAKYFPLFQQLLAMEAAQRGDTSLLFGTVGTRGTGIGSGGRARGERGQP